ncbi:MAG: hypothetical protein ACI81R_002046 [Bradymonadia bacterium]|jgi:uncharacterized protein (TIGR01244 family)
MSDTVPDLSILNAKRPATGIVSGGQPSPTQIAAAGEAGFRSVLTTRGEGEIGDYDERGDVERAGMVFHELPIAGMGDLSRKNVQAFATLVDSLPRPLLIHCGSGNRIGALFALRAAWLDGADEETALQRGAETGLTGLAPVIRQLIQREA